MIENLTEPEHRKLSTIRIIDAINPIEGADSIECATIGGWKVVVKKGEFKEGELAVYLEIDSWVPTELAPFLTKGKEPREYNGVKGERLRTVKLRGQISQGLLLPITVVSFAVFSYTVDGVDVTSFLNIQKYEKPMSAQLAGMAKGNFPSFIPKTDQERIQNLKKEFNQYKEQGLTFEVTEKLDGSSMTVYLNNGEFGVCSRNLDLKETEGNSFWQMARSLDLETVLRGYGCNIALQGELIGPGIQGNIYGLTKLEFRIFDIFIIDKQEYFKPFERRAFVKILELAHVPEIGYNIPLGENDTIETVLKWAENISQIPFGFSPQREGIVFKCMSDPSISFKAISNVFLLGEK